MQKLHFWVKWHYTQDNKYVTMGAYDINAYFKKPYIENLNGGYSQYGFCSRRWVHHKESLKRHRY